MAPECPGKSLERPRGLRVYNISYTTVYNPSYFIKNKKPTLSVSEEYSKMDHEIASSVADTTGDAMSMTTVEHNEEQLSIEVDEADLAQFTVMRRISLDNVKELNGVESARDKLTKLANDREADIETVSKVIKRGQRHIRVRKSALAIKLPMLPPPVHGGLLFTEAMVEAGVEPGDLDNVLSDKEAIEGLEETWTDFKDLIQRGLQDTVMHYRAY